MSKKKATERPVPSTPEIELFFSKYKSLNEDQIGPDEMDIFCQDLGIDANDITLLVLAWHLKSKRLGYFSKEEFISGMIKLRVSDINTLRALLDNVKKNFDKMPADKFLDLYIFSFNYCLMRPSQKILDPLPASIMLKLVMQGRPHVDKFTQFLVETGKGINLDQWKMFLNFSETIEPDFSNYSTDDSWPFLIDEYVEFYQDKQTEPEPDLDNYKSPQ